MTTKLVIDHQKLAGWNTYISPGVVGSVGDTHMQIRLKQSNPDMPMRYNPIFSHKREKRVGSNVQDGHTASYSSKGGPSRVIDTLLTGTRNFKTNVGWRHQDIRATDRVVQPTVGATPNYSWTNRVATLYKGRVNGENFLPLPGGYGLPHGETPANGSGPVITNVIQPQRYPTDMPVERGIQYENNDLYNPEGVRERLGREARQREEYLNHRGPQRRLVPSRRTL